MTQPLATIAARIMTLPTVTFARTLGKLDRLLQDGEIATPIIASVIASDPVLTAVILGRAAIVAPGEVTSVNNALVVLGTATVHGLVKNVRPLPEPCQQAVAGIWSLANATAAMCRILGTASPVLRDRHLPEETMHALGLTHDLGSMVGHLLFSGEMCRASARLGGEPRRTFASLLQEELGAPPALLGSLWAHHLNLPPLLVRSMHHQDNPLLAGEETHGPMLVQLARNLVKGAGFASAHDPYVDPFDAAIVEGLGLSLGDIQHGMERFFDEEEELALYEGALLFRP